MTKRTHSSDTESVLQPKVIGTHSGTFHCDEVLACFMLRQLPEYKTARIFRSRNDNELRDQCDIIVDVGGEFSHENKRYDHHQNTFKETLSTLRPEFGNDYNVKLSSAGLIYTFYGERIIDNIVQTQRNIELTSKELKLAFIQIYKNFIREIDAIDNGVPMYENGSEPLYTIHTHLSARVGKLNISWEEENYEQTLELQRFEQAMDTVGQEFVQNVVHISASWLKARKYVQEALENAKNIHASGQILVLERFCPWKVHLFDLEKEYQVEGIAKLVIFNDNDGSWRVAGVPTSPDSFLGRQFLPVSWRGLRDEALSEVAGIPNLKFVHHTGFIAGATTKDAAFEMAIKSIQMQAK